MGRRMGQRPTSPRRDCHHSHVKHMKHVYLLNVNITGDSWYYFIKLESTYGPFGAWPGPGQFGTFFGA
eukprot:3028901-Lingulodinium_polyedra.AAC.1